jgi:hypothetical protein
VKRLAVLLVAVALVACNPIALPVKAPVKAPVVKPVTKPVPAKPLTGKITVSWLGKGVSDQLEKTDHTCYSYAPGIGAGCGSVVVSVLIAGFSQYGGVPTCEGQGCYDAQGPGIGGTLRLYWLLSCDENGDHYEHTQTVDLGPEWHSSNSNVTGVTRVNADSARLEIAADVPAQADVEACPSQLTILDESASLVAVQLQKGTRSPAATFVAGGPFGRTHPFGW